MGPRPFRQVVALVCGTVLAGCAGDPPTVGPAGVDLLEVPTPSVDPDDFGSGIDNPWLPLRPGAEWVYETTDGETLTVTVTDRTREVAGVTVTEVRDVVTDAGGTVLAETHGWFAQDSSGNVWSFGEDTVEHDDRGRPDRAGSWEAGVDGALAGLVMPAEPRRGDGYPQEYLEGEAEDRATVLSVGSEEQTVPFGSFDRLLVTEETTPLEPGLVERKFYARGVGLVFEETVAGGSDRAALVGFTEGAAAR